MARTCRPEPPNLSREDCPIPRREDERNFSLSGQHPAYCTCTGCTERFLQRRKIKPARKAAGSGEKVKPHPENCNCATCRLLASVGDLPPLPRRKPGLLRRLFGKGRQSRQ